MWISNEKTFLDLKSKSREKFIYERNLLVPAKLKPEGIQNQMLEGRKQEEKYLSKWHWFALYNAPMGEVQEAQVSFLYCVEVFANKAYKVANIIKPLA